MFVYVNLFISTLPLPITVMTSKRQTMKDKPVRIIGAFVEIRTAHPVKALPIELPYSVLCTCIDRSPMYTSDVIGRSV
jgi:hypothetical protein